MSAASYEKRDNVTPELVENLFCDMEGGDDEEESYWKQ
jgi:hypothetical protein